VFVCENNRYMEFTPIEDVTAGDIAARVEALGLWSQTVDGMDVQAVVAGASEAVAHARSGGGPAFLQTLTYRFVGHSRSDPGAYRKPGELDEMRERDPLTIERARLLGAGAADENELDELAARVARQVDDVVERALAAPFPSAEAEFQEYAG
jgi:TPP-dependent pyruvate/acetoin dehydrogenase alpha subunit